MAAFPLVSIGAPLVRQEAPGLLLELQSAGAYQMFYNMSGYGYVLAWGISFYPQFILNWRRKSTAGMSIGFLWYNLLGFMLYLVYTTYAPDCTVQDQMFAGHALLVTACTLMQVPLYATNRLGDFPQLHGKIAAVLLVVLDLCLVANVGKYLSMMNLIYACGYLKTTISLIKYTPQFFLNMQRKSTAGFAIGMVFCDITGGVLSLVQQFVGCSYDASTGLMRDEWTWQPFSGNKPKLFLGLIAIFYDLSFMYQHFVLYGAPENVSSAEASIPSAASLKAFSREPLNSIDKMKLKMEERKALVEAQAQPLGDSTPCSEAKGSAD